MDSLSFHICSCANDQDDSIAYLIGEMTSYRVCVCRCESLCPVPPAFVISMPKKLLTTGSRMLVQSNNSQSKGYSSTIRHWKSLLSIC